MRGILQFHTGIMRGEGIIPAHAGHTCLYSPSRGPAWDHPRTCGAYFSLSNLPFCTLGSSPHMRGIPDVPCRCMAAPGIIPAHAGHTIASATTYMCLGDHPRTCGAYTPHAKPPAVKAGSSPHMRGIRDVRAEDCRAFGIIPAHAGHTIRFAAQDIAARDHPRTCGAYLQTCGSASADTGSSPHMRGILSKLLHITADTGIIPAHAGHTVDQRDGIIRYRDHPRTCGAYTLSTPCAPPASGSSPHMRGILVQFCAPF